MDLSRRSCLVCACAWIVWIGRVHANSMEEEQSKTEVNKCQADYYIGEYPGECLPCWDICHDDMRDFYVDLNCRLSCPDYYRRLMMTTSTAVTATSGVTTANPASRKLLSHPSLGTLTIALITVLTLAAIVLLTAIITILRRWTNKSSADRSKSSSLLCWSRDESGTHQDSSDVTVPIPVENGDVGPGIEFATHRSAFVPSGMSYPENVDSRTPLHLELEMHQTVV